MTFDPHTISEETYLAYTRADDSFRPLDRHVWRLPALANTYSIKQPDLYYYEPIKLTSQA